MVGISMAVVTRSLVLASVVAASCSPHKVTRNPAPPVVVPAAWSGQGGAADAPDQWWKAFADPELDALIDRALAENLQLAAVWAALDQVGAVVTMARSPKLPEVSASLSGGRQRSRIELPDPVGVQYFSSNVLSASLAAGYEVDLWRRHDAGYDAAKLDALALRDDLESVAMTLVAQISEAWLDVRFQRARGKLLTEQLANNQKSLDLLEARFREGLGSALDVYQQRSLVAGTRAQIVTTEAQLVVLEGRLAVLLSTTVGEVRGQVEAAPESLPEPPPVPAVGVPASLLDRRPDVRAARRRVEAADERVAAAVADRLPSLRISGSVDARGSELADLIKSPLYSIFASVTAPLFDYGRRKAEVRRRRAVVEQELAGYGDVMLTAMVEVEVALAQEKHQQALIAELVEQAELAASTVGAARDAYREGQIDYLPVLSAVQGEQQVALAILQARRQLLSLRVTLYRALGGTWTAALERKE
jgi:NodT family efflux transporter outer membrane factor (OMF) lipoprotein